MMPVLANILQPLIDINEAILRFWHNDIGLSWGASIIGLTVVIRILILPLLAIWLRAVSDRLLLALFLMKSTMSGRKHVPVSRSR